MRSDATVSRSRSRSEGAIRDQQPSGPPHPDQDLYHRCILQDAGAWAALNAEYFDQLVRLAHVLAPRNEAEDLAQDAIMSFVQSCTELLEEHRRGASLPPLADSIHFILYRRLKCAVANWFRWITRKKRTGRGKHAQGEGALEGASEVERRMDARAVLNAIYDKNPRWGYVVDAHLIEPNWEPIAFVLGVSTHSAQKLHRAAMDWAIDHFRRLDKRGHL